MRKRWTEYIKGQYVDHEKKDKYEIRKLMVGQTITTDEVEKAMKKMKCEKAVGHDNIAIEVVNAL